MNPLCGHEASYTLMHGGDSVSCYGVDVAMIQHLAPILNMDGHMGW